jgi:uncharacterized protein DUF4129
VSEAAGFDGDARRGAGPASPGSVAAPPAIIALVERLLAAGKEREATLLAFRTAEEHLRQVFRMTLPRQWTHREFLRRFLRADMGPSGELLTRLHARFEPVRYGAAPPVDSTGLIELVRALYREPPLRSTHLYPAGMVARLPREVATGSGEEVAGERPP